MNLADEALLSREDLDADYTAKLTCTAEEFAQITQSYLDRSKAAHDLPNRKLDILYDAASGETYDLFGTSPKGLRPCFVFIHGGYWRALSKHYSAMMAPMLAGQGIATAVVDYTLAPKASIAEITRQCRAMLAHLWHNAESLGVDRDRIVVGGSSAGGHLTSIVASGGWQGDYDLPAQPLMGQLPISGLFDLAALAGSHVNDWMQFTPQQVADYSPARHLPDGDLPAVVALAERETPGFYRQSRAYAAAIKAPVLVIPDRNHFDVLLDLADPQTQLSQALLGLFHR